MARIILKSTYLKPRGKSTVGNYIRYIATRDGVERIDESKKFLPATEKQKRLIKKMLQAYSDVSELPEHEIFMGNPTRQNADNLILKIAEEQGEWFGDRENYISYIAQRPRVETVDEKHSHGLFTDDGVPIVMSDVMQEVSQHRGNIWTHIVSLHREDAERLGYDSAEAWVQLLRSQRNTIAQSMKIAPENFRWYAAFHNEGHHPHIHMVAYSVDPKEGYLTPKGIETIKASLAREIFREDMLAVYAAQTSHRDALRSEARQMIEEIVERIHAGGYDNPKMAEMLLKLSDELSRSDGKMVYAYLTSDLKKLVNAIVDELAKDERITELYNLWYGQREKILEIYTDNLPPRVPLSENEEFRPIKNAVIKEAVNLISLSNVRLRTKSKSGYAAVASLRLLRYLSEILRDRYFEEQENAADMVDSKLRAAINEKKRAHGLKQ